MPPRFFRLIALLMIPCLLADPVASAAFSGPLARRQYAQTQAPFEREALMLTLGAGLFAAYHQGWLPQQPFIQVHHWLISLLGDRAGWVALAALPPVRRRKPFDAFKETLDLERAWLGFAARLEKTYQNNPTFDIARRTGITPAKLMNLRTGIGFPEEDQLRRLADYFQTTPQKLFPGYQAAWKIYRNLTASKLTLSQEDRKSSDPARLLAVFEAVEQKNGDILAIAQATGRKDKEVYDQIKKHPVLLAKVQSQNEARRSHALQRIQDTVSKDLESGPAEALVKVLTSFWKNIKDYRELRALGTLAPLLEGKTVPEQIRELQVSQKEFQEIRAQLKQLLDSKIQPESALGAYLDAKFRGNWVSPEQKAEAERQRKLNKPVRSRRSKTHTLLTAEERNRRAVIDFLIRYRQASSLPEGYALFEEAKTAAAAQAVDLDELAGRVPEQARDFLRRLYPPKLIRPRNPEPAITTPQPVERAEPAQPTQPTQPEVLTQEQVEAPLPKPAKPDPADAVYRPLLQHARNTDPDRNRVPAHKAQEVLGDIRKLVNEVGQLKVIHQTALNVLTDAIDELPKNNIKAAKMKLSEASSLAAKALDGIVKTTSKADELGVYPVHDIAAEEGLALQGLSARINRLQDAANAIELLQQHIERLDPHDQEDVHRIRIEIGQKK
jgi:hypothetical protein